MLHQTVARPTSTASVMINDMPLPPTYIPPESTIQDLDATFFYVIGGMTILAMAFGNLIILNFVSRYTSDIIFNFHDTVVIFLFLKKTRIFVKFNCQFESRQLIFSPNFFHFCSLYTLYYFISSQHS